MSVESRRPDLVLLDIWLQGSELDGLEILRRIKKHHTKIPVLMMSGHGTVETAVAAIKDGAYDFIEKPFKADRLLLLVDRAIEAAELRRENVELRYRAGPDTDLIGASRGIRGIRQIIEQVAPTNSRVLISGPAGCGKEVVARALHTLSQRASGPFEVLNCASLSPNARKRNFLASNLKMETPPTDPVSAQLNPPTMERCCLTKSPICLWRCKASWFGSLQDQAFQRIGSNSRVEVNVRFIAITSRHLEDEIAAGKFREDLFYRLNVVPIEVPPLRSRREDLQDLADHFLRRSCEMRGQPRRSFSTDAIAALQAYEWPGNVRELKNIVERMMILSTGEPGTEVTAAAVADRDLQRAQRFFCHGLAS